MDNRWMCRTFWKSSLLTSCVAVSLLLSNGLASAQEVATGDRLWREFQAEQQQAQAEWQQYESTESASWRQNQREIEQKWRELIVSTNKEWVAYDDRLETRSRVDFEKGEVVVETVVSKTERQPGPGWTAMKKRILQQLMKISQQVDATGKAILADQLQGKDGRKIGIGAFKKYAEQELLPKITLESSRPANGRQLDKHIVRFNLAPDHLKVRALRYLPIVVENAGRFNLEPQLLMAVIHTESYFNPLAISSAGAIGLMQVVPRHAGREAYHYLYGRNWAITADYLFAPGINVELGAAYLALLKERYFGEIIDREKNLYLTICAYNWGPGAVEKQIIQKNRVGNMSAAGLFNVLSASSPRETRDYLQKVTERRRMYAGYFAK